MRMNLETKLVFALEHVAHLHDLIEDNEYQKYLNQHLTSIEYEFERQLNNERHRKQRKCHLIYYFNWKKLLTNLVVIYPK